MLYFQGLVKKALMSHRKLEEEAGREIFPALPDGGLMSKEEIFCNKLESACGGGSKHLDW